MKKVIDLQLRAKKVHETPFANSLSEHFRYRTIDHETIIR